MEANPPKMRVRILLINQRAAMDESELIDDLPKSIHNEHFLDAVRWWEKKRLPYTAFIIATGIIAVVYSGMDIGNFGIIRFIVNSFAWILFVNICYCSGLVIELLTIYYFKWNGIADGGRITMFILGTILSILITYFMVDDAMHFRPLI